VVNGGDQFPLSGDIIQDINPINWWIKGGQQIGFINIRGSRAGDVSLERTIVEDVASYGRQLGRIIDVLEVLVARRPDDLTDSEIVAVDAFCDLAREIAAVKEASRPQGVLAAVDRTITEVQAQQRRNPKLYKEAVARFHAAFGQ
jgi:hypothetical protein